MNISRLLPFATAVEPLDIGAQDENTPPAQVQPKLRKRLSGYDDFSRRFHSSKSDSALATTVASHGLSVTLAAIGLVRGRPVFAITTGGFTKVGRGLQIAASGLNVAVTGLAAVELYLRKQRKPVSPFDRVADTLADMLTKASKPPRSSGEETSLLGLLTAASKPPRSSAEATSLLDLLRDTQHNSHSRWTPPSF